MPLIIFSYFLMAFFSCLSAEQTLTRQQREFFQSHGYIVIENFVDDRTLDDLRRRAHTLVSQCDFDALASIYEASHGEISWENYYFNQGQPLCYFFEAQAFQTGCTLTKHQCIKKISYALHAWDACFNSFPTITRFNTSYLSWGSKTLC